MSMKIRTVILALCLVLAGIVRAMAEEPAQPAPIDSGPQRVLALLAHPDDELVIINILKSQVEAGKRVFVIWTTSGDKGGATAEVREAESNAVMDLVGVEPVDRYFLRYPDTLSFQHLPQIMEKVVNLVSEIKPQTMYCDAYEGGNIDHDIVNFACAKALEITGVPASAFEFPLYNHYGGKMRFTEFIPVQGIETIKFPLDKDGLDFKVKCLEAYKSQAKTLQGMKFMIMTSAREVAEEVRPMPGHDYLNPPHEGRLLYEFQNRHKFGQFHDAVAAWLKGQSGE